jgi:glycosyltransferase involved in cell wall biosynthesis
VPPPLPLSVRSGAPFPPTRSAGSAATRTSALPQAPITATILTRNSEQLLPAVLHSLQWCDEIVVLDSGSTDRTLSVACSFSNVRLHRLAEDFPGFGLARHQAVSLASHDWVLSIDSDEIVSPELAEEIAALPLDPRCVYTVPFDNYYNGKLITTCGWAPDRHERLFNRAATNFSPSVVHERVRTSRLDVVHLRHPIRHFSYRTPDDFLRKMAFYSRLFADQNAGRTGSSPGKAASRSLWAFFKSYILERGVLQGSEGLVISAYKAQTVFWKYVMLHQTNRTRSA